MIKFIRIQSDQLQEIIHDRLIKHIANEDDIDEVITAIMEDISKTNPFKVWRR